MLGVLLTTAVPALTAAAETPRQTEIQRIETEDGRVLEMLDTRGEGEVSGLTAARSASSKGYVVALLRGDDPGHFETTSAALTLLIDAGFEKIGLIRTDHADTPGDDPAILSVLSQGKSTAHFRNDNVGDKGLVAYVVRHVYDRDLGRPAAVEERLAALHDERARLQAQFETIQKERAALAEHLRQLDEQARIGAELQARLEPFTRAPDGRLVDGELETIVSQYERRTGERINRSDRAAVVAAVERETAKIRAERDAYRARLDRQYK